MRLKNVEMVPHFAIVCFLFSPKKMILGCWRRYLVRFQEGLSRWMEAEYRKHVLMIEYDSHGSVRGEAGRGVPPNAGCKTSPFTSPIDGFQWTREADASRRPIAADRRAAGNKSTLNQFRSGTPDREMVSRSLVYRWRPVIEAISGPKYFGMISFGHLNGTCSDYSSFMLQLLTTSNQVSGWNSCQEFHQGYDLSKKIRSWVLANGKSWKEKNCESIPSNRLLELY